MLNHGWLSIIFVGFLLLDHREAAAQWGRNSGWCPGPGIFGWGWGGGPGMIFSLLFWAAVIAGIVIAIRWLVTSIQKPGGLARNGGAMDILRDRYARGEIDKDEFEARKRDLSQSYP